MQTQRTKPSGKQSLTADQTVATNYGKIFHPKRMAIVGVSSEGRGFGSGVFMSIKSMGFEGEIFPVNPKGGKFAGQDILKM